MAPKINKTTAKIIKSSGRPIDLNIVLPPLLLDDFRVNHSKNILGVQSVALAAIDLLYLGSFFSDGCEGA